MTTILYNTTDLTDIAASYIAGWGKLQDNIEDRGVITGLTAWTNTSALTPIFGAFKVVSDIGFGSSSRNSSKFTISTANIQYKTQNTDQSIYLNNIKGYVAPDVNIPALSHVIIDDAYVSGINPGTHNFWNLMHEIGHALGLEHPSATGDGEDPAFNHSTTIMSYNSWNGQYAETLMIDDIKDIQSVYGYNRTSATGFGGNNNIFTLEGDKKLWTIWDGGGTGDTLKVMETETRDAVLDLRGGKSHFSHVGEEYAFIAFDPENDSGVVEIEKAIGGKGKDKIFGNDINNELTGGEGNDILYGGDGTDIYLFNDTFGEDIINESGDLGDGKGRIVINGDTLSGSFEMEDDMPDQMWWIGTETDNKGSVFLNGGTLYVYKEDAEGVIKIDNFKNDGGFGFTLGGLPAKDPGHPDVPAPPSGNEPHFDPKADDINKHFKHPPASPLVIDYDRDGLIELTPLSDSSHAYFDLDADGFVEQTGWMQADDGLLCRDLNGNGIIDNITELFGNATTDGMEILAALDEDDDGRITDFYSDDGIDFGEAAYSTLLLWRDLDGDGYSDAGELQSLRNAGIESINVYNWESRNEVNQGHLISSEATFTTDTNAQGIIQDVWFQHNQAHSFYIKPVGFTYDVDILTLPQLRGSAHVTDLWVSMSQNTAQGTALKAAVQAIENANYSNFTFAAYRNSIEAVMEKWLGVETVNSETRGQYIDAKIVEALEEYIGKDYVQTAGVNAGTPYPGPWSSAGMVKLWDELVDVTAVRMMVQSPDFPLAQAVANAGLKYDFFLADLTGNFTTFIDAIKTNQPSGSMAQQTYWQDLQPMINAVADSLNISDAAYNTVLAGTWLDTNNSAALSTLRNGMTLGGTDGAETLIGGDASDYLASGKDNDRMQGDIGNDSYAYFKGDGNDTINDAGGTDKLLIGPGIAPNQVTLSHSGINDLLVTIASAASGGYVLVQNQFLTANAMETIVFDNGLTIQASQIQGIINNYAGVVQGSANYAPIRTNAIPNRTATEGQAFSYQFASNLFIDIENSTLTYTATKADGSGRPSWLNFDETTHTFYGTPDSNAAGILSIRLIASDGQASTTDEFNIVIADTGSTVPGGSGGSTISGDDGNNNLYGTPGNDTIQGLGGNDYILSEEGDDVVSGGNGNDTIFGWTGNDTLSGDVGDDQIGGDDGADSISGNDGNDHLFGWNGNDTIYGGTGNDYIDGEGDNDQLRGEAGNDTIYGGAGNDLIIGGAGADSLYGDATGFSGADSFRYFSRSDSTDAATDWIKLFKPTVGDRIDLTGLGFSDLRQGYGTGNILGWEFHDGSTKNVRLFSDTFSINVGYESTISGVSLGDFVGVGPGFTIHRMGTDTVDSIIDSVAGGHTGISGGLGNDMLDGSDGNDTLDGGAGSDTLKGRAGADVYFYDELTDSPNEGRDLIQTWDSSTDRIDVRFLGYTGFDTVAGAAAHDSILTYAKNTVGNYTTVHNSNGFEIKIEGVHTLTASNFIFSTGPGFEDENYTGTNNADTHTGQQGNDSINGGAGADSLSGGVGADTLIGGTGDDTLIGGLGSDQLDGGADYDYMVGGDGNDLLIGGSGEDYMTGGIGIDTFLFNFDGQSTPSHWDYIVDFEADVDKIKIKDLGYTHLVADATPTGDELGYYSSGGDVWLKGTLNGGFLLQLNGAIPLFSSDDVVFIN